MALRFFPGDLVRGLEHEIGVVITVGPTSVRILRVHPNPVKTLKIMRTGFEPAYWWHVDGNHVESSNG